MLRYLNSVHIGLNKGLVSVTVADVLLSVILQDVLQVASYLFLWTQTLVT